MFSPIQGLCSTLEERIYWEGMMHQFAALITHMQLVSIDNSRRLQFSIDNLSYFLLL